jgi:AAA+ superfamily predicted ATPase
MEHVQIAATPRERFMHAAKRELARFERQEIEFRKREHEERAAELRLPIENQNIH